jgi:hypothetical protein
MGKSHRKVISVSSSVDYHSEHNRGFAKDKKARSHRRIRKHNYNCNEETVEVFNCKQQKMKHSGHCGYIGELNNVPNYEGYLDDEWLNFEYDYRFDNKDKTPIETINTILDTNNKLLNKNYLISTKKQLERRGKAARFYGHR